MRTSQQRRGRPPRICLEDEAYPCNDHVSLLGDSIQITKVIHFTHNHVIRVFPDAAIESSFTFTP